MKRFGQTLAPFKIIPRLAELGSQSAAQALSVLYTHPVNTKFKVGQIDIVVYHCNSIMVFLFMFYVGHLLITILK